MAFPHYQAAAIQFEPAFGQKARNIDRLLELTEGAAKRGARLIVLPEMATTGYCWHDRDEIRPLVEPIPGPTTDAFAALARRYGCFIVVGLPEVVAPAEIFFNSAALIGPDGVVGVYRKSHSFISEPKWAKDGDLGLPVWDTALGRIGILICADAEYVEPARILALQGADVLCFPTNWVGEKSPPAQWIARAWENGCYLIAANRYGSERGIQFSGGSGILNPDGTIQASQDAGDGIVAGDISLSIARDKSFLPGGLPEKLSGRHPNQYDTLTLNTYLFNPLEFHGLYDHRPLPRGGSSRVAVVQMAPLLGAPEANLGTMREMLEGLPDGVDLVVYPEYALSGRPLSETDARMVAAPSRPDWLARLVDLASGREAHLVVGYVEVVDGDYFSTTLMVGPDGEVARYRKAHPIGSERLWCRPGAGRPPVIDLAACRVGIVTGSDLCFPETARGLAIAGCDLLSVPAGPGVPPPLAGGPTAIPLDDPAGLQMDPMHFHLGRQRAVENNCYVAFASLPAPDGIGCSAVFGPDREARRGEVVLGGGVVGTGMREVNTSNLETPYPTSVVRAKETIRRRQPLQYDLLQHPDPPAACLLGSAPSPGTPTMGTITADG